MPYVIVGPTGAGGGGQGPTGPQGPPGTDGKTIYSGLGVPPGATGVLGDFYLDRTNSRLYGPKVDVGAWPPGSLLLVGPQGQTGAQGVQGLTGTTGGQGPQGVAGANGTNGVNGNSVRNGTANPIAGIGVDGDFYINTATSQVFGPKTSGAWGSGVSLIGPTGLTGNTGGAGPTGAAGNTVLNGTSDPVSQGVAGDFYINTTSKFIFGPKTTVWPTGTALASGATGPAGPAGSVGLSTLQLLYSTPLLDFTVAGNQTLWTLPTTINGITASAVIITQTVVRLAAAGLSTINIAVGTRASTYTDLVPSTTSTTFFTNLGAVFTPGTAGARTNPGATVVAAPSAGSMGLRMYIDFIGYGRP